jgi:serine/threonine protein kinase
MPPTTDKIKAIFLAALDKATLAERAAFLDELCGADATLRQRVEALLQAHDQPDHLLDRPAADHLSGEPDGAAGSDDSFGFLTPSRKPDSLGRLDHYEVLEVAGRGGMGVVFRAFDDKLQRVVAIKALAPQLATNSAARRRFVREARAAAAVTHENVIAIHAVEDTGAVPYLVMQFVHGVSLQEKIEHTGALPLQETLRIGLHIAEGLAAAHRQGLVHRDIKPANILLENGVERVKLTDFGLARAGDDASLTQSGVVAGTPLYMSPEQAQGQPVDFRSDLFSLGSVLYTMCAGRPPFRAPTALAVLKRVCEEMPRPIREVNPELPAWLGDLLTRLHAKAPAGRFASAQEVADLLARHLAELQHGSATSLPAVARSAESRGENSTVLRPVHPRRRWLMAASVLMVLLTGLGLSEATGVTHVRATVIRLLSGEGTRWNEANKPSERWSAAPRPDSKLGKPWPVPSPEDLAKRSAPADALQREAIPPELLKTAGAGDPNRAPPQLVAVLGRDEHDGQPNSGCMLYALAISPNGKTLAAGGIDKIVRLWDLETGQLSQELTGHQQPGVEAIYTLAFSPDGKLLASGDRQGTIKLWDATTGRERYTLAEPGGDLYQVAFSPDGRFLAAGRQSGSVQLWEVSSGKLHASLPGNKEAWCVAFSPDSQVLASGELQYVHLWDVVTGRKVGSLPAQSTTVRWVGFRPDGRSLVTAAMVVPNDLALRVWKLPALGEKQRLEGHTSPVLTAAWRADGRLLATAGCTDGTVRLWDMDAGPPRCKPLLVIPPNVPWLHAIAFSPEGRHLAVSNPDGTVYILRLAKPGEVFRVP